MILVVVAIRALVCAGATIDTFVEVSIVDPRVDVSVDLLTCIISGVVTNIDIDMLVVTVFTEFDASRPLDEYCSCAAFDCRPMAALGCASVSQALMPSYHV